MKIKDVYISVTLSVRDFLCRVLTLQSGHEVLVQKMLLSTISYKRFFLRPRSKIISIFIDISNFFDQIQAKCILTSSPLFTLSEEENLAGN